MAEGAGKTGPAGLVSERDRGELTIASRLLNRPQHHLAAELLAFWREARQRGALLDKRDIPCPRLAPLLPNLFLFAPVDATRSDWICRLVGGAIRERYGGPNQLGRRLSQTDPPEIAARRSGNYRTVVETLEPRLMRGRLLNIGRDFYEVEVVNLPVIGTKKSLWVLGGMFFWNDSSPDQRKPANPSGL